MRALFLPLALAAVLAAPLAAQAPRFIKVDVVSKSMKGHQNEDGPTQVHVRMPLSLAKSLLESVSDKEFKIHGSMNEGKKSKRIHKIENLKFDQLVKLLEACKPGDMLLEVTTDKGDLVKITVE
jgi:hypothetical protein